MNFLLNFFKGKSVESVVDFKDKLGFLEVDMHNHILPGIDDGCDNMEDSIALVTNLNLLGFKKLVCTPHVMRDVHPNTPSTISDAHSDLSSSLLKVGNLTEIYAAAEYMADDGFHSIVESGQLCVIPGGYVLIEMSYLSEYTGIFSTIEKLQNLGYKPVLAHPERYNYHHRNFDFYKTVKDVGCLLQLNLLSISRYYGTDVKVAALSLLKSGMYDFVGTDVHHEKHLNAIKEVAAKYPVKDMLKSCTILNPTLQDHMFELDHAHVQVS